MSLLIRSNTESSEREKYRYFPGSRFCLLRKDSLWAKANVYTGINSLHAMGLVLFSLCVWTLNSFIPLHERVINTFTSDCTSCCCVLHNINDLSVFIFLPYTLSSFRVLRSTGMFYWKIPAILSACSESFAWSVWISSIRHSSTSSCVGWWCRFTAAAHVTSWLIVTMSFCSVFIPVVPLWLQSPRFKRFPSASNHICCRTNGK